MSTTSKYKCNACGYSTDGCDEPDKASIATGDTRHCLGCKSLVEVPIEFHGGMFTDDPDVVPSSLNRCPYCNSTNIVPWKVVDGCSKCGEHMTKAAKA